MCVCGVRVWLKGREVKMKMREFMNFAFMLSSLCFRVPLLFECVCNSDVCLCNCICVCVMLVGVDIT